MIVFFKRKQIILLIFSTILIIIFWLFLLSNDPNKNFDKNNYDIENGKCLNDIDNLNLDKLGSYVQILKSSKIPYCNDLSKRFNDIFEIDEFYGEMSIPSDYVNKIKKWLNNDEELIAQVKKQKIIKLYNKYMNEEMIFNPIRGKRPQIKEKISEKNFSFSLLKDSVKDCDFCENNYLKNTAYDTFGRLETKYSYTAANTFKYDKWHSLIVSRNHDTLNLNEIETIDMFNLALKWFDKVNKIDNNAKYPEILWDAMPKSGASQVHTHLQASMGINSYYGAMKRLLTASKLYYNDYKRDYLDDFILIHQALGLSMLFNKTYVILNLIPVKEHELIIISRESENNDEIFRVLHHLIRAYVDVMEKYSFSMAMFLPEYSKEKTLKNKIMTKYKFCRIVFRTPVSNLRSDINGLDLYTSSVLGIDRYQIASKLFPILRLSL